MDPDDRFSSVNDDISGLVDSLRQAGTQRELRGESSAVDAIVSATTTESISMTPRFIGKARVASFVAAGIIGFGGVAAAGPAVIDQIDGDDEPTTTNVEETETTGTDDPVTTDVETDETVTTDVETDETVTTDVDDETVTTAPEVTTTTEVQTTTTTEVQTTTTTEVEEPDSGEDDETDGDVVLVDDPDTAFDETECAEGNHGKTVSSDARTEGRTSQDVVDAAQSSCGKDDTSDDSDDDAADDDDANDDADDKGDDDDDTSRDEGQSNGNGNGGNGNSGNGNGGG